MFAKTPKSGNLEEEFELLKAAAEMAFDDSHPIEFYLEQLAEQMETTRRNLVEMEAQWCVVILQLNFNRSYYCMLGNGVFYLT